jgi:hypothetical protein
MSSPLILGPSDGTGAASDGRITAEQILNTWTLAWVNRPPSRTRPRPRPPVYTPSTTRDSGPRSSSSGILIKTRVGGHHSNPPALSVRAHLSPHGVRESERRAKDFGLADTQGRKLTATRSARESCHERERLRTLARVTQVLVEQHLHSCVGPVRPRARSLAASRSRSWSMSGRFWATYLRASRTAGRGT